MEATPKGKALCVRDLGILALQSPESLIAASAMLEGGSGGQEPPEGSGEGPSCRFQLLVVASSPRLCPCV